MNKKVKIGIVLGVMCFALTLGICIQIKTVKQYSTKVGQNYDQNNRRAEVLKYKERYENKIKEIDKLPPKFPARNMDVGPSAPPIMQTVVCSFIFITLPRISNKNPIQQPTRPNTFFTV